MTFCFTVLFVTHSIPEAIRIGNRILLLSPHPGQVKAELNSDGTDPEDPATSERLSERIHRMLFAEHNGVEELPSMLSHPAARPEYVREQVQEHDFAVVNKPLSAWERVRDNGVVRRLFILAVLAAIWQAYAAYLDNELVLIPVQVDLQRFEPTL